jgi:hypothetical protein
LQDRFVGNVEITFVAFKDMKEFGSETFLPWHRVNYFRIGTAIMQPMSTSRKTRKPQAPVDDAQFPLETILWHRKRRIDAVFHSTPSSKRAQAAAAAAAPSSGTFVEPCRFYALGLCRKGPKCHYRHGRAPSSDAAAAEEVKVEDYNADEVENAEIVDEASTTTSSSTSTASAPAEKRVRVVRFTDASASSNGDRDARDELMVFAKRLTWLLRHGAGDEGVLVRADGYARVADVLALRLLRGFTQR